MLRLVKVAKYSLALLWIFTGLTSMFFLPEVGYEILAKAKIVDDVADTAVYAGGMLDVLLGLWILTAIGARSCCIVQISVIAIYTVLLTFIEPNFWLHPFGPITKNIPIIVLILIIYNSEKEQCGQN